MVIWVVVSNIVYFHRDPWGNDPIRRAYVSNGWGNNHQLLMFLGEKFLMFLDGNDDLIHWGG